MNNESLKCSQEVRKIPLERFRLAGDGRKWKQAARSRSAFLLRLASYANADGTFTRDGRNYSPSLETLLEHVGHGSYYLFADALQALGLLSWTREKHYERRIYTIHLPEQVQDSPENTSKVRTNQVQDSEITGPTFAGEDAEQVQDSPEQVQHSQITGPTSSNHPSLPSEEPSNTLEPSNPPAIKSVGGSDGTSLTSDSTSKPFASLTAGKEKEELSGWRAEFQLEVQKVAQWSDVVFSVPLPASVFEYVEDLANDCDMKTAQQAALEWLSNRNLDGFQNVNGVWKFMPDEMAGIADQAIEGYHRSQRRIIAAVS